MNSKISINPFKMNKDRLPDCLLDDYLFCKLFLSLSLVRHIEFKKSKVRFTIADPENPHTYLDGIPIV